MPPTPLPRQSPDPRWTSSYDLLLKLEAQHLDDDRSKLVAVRLLGHLMHEIGTNDSDALHRAIIALAAPGSGGDEVIALGKVYLRSFVSLFRRSSRTPAPSEHPSRDHETSSTNELKPGTFDHHTAKRHALIRDEHQCCVCSAYDKASTKMSPEVGKKAEERFATAGQTTVTTDAVHIVPERLNCGITTFAEFQGDEEEGEVISSLLVTENVVPSFETKAHQSSSVYAVFRAFGTAAILEELNGQAIHRLENILTLCIQHHQDFNDLDLWLEHTGVPNEYRIQVSVERLRPKGSASQPVQTVMLRGDDDSLPPPSVGYLALHATCCKVAQKSGAVQYLNDIDDNFGDAVMDARYVSSSAVCDALIQSLEVMPCRN
ncbi:hypothetical protein Hypma_016236 [Hypsizygus marmoreus]|uniref:HNH nuclease domain-containing protein n=1 Tax=Hypsizygus marmoreus TaxID=39966 RepID=A0A369J0V4_HYPMA|nr:hypothetical protein Hypma_016236 [Hypsizygus marmoreus]